MDKILIQQITEPTRKAEIVSKVLHTLPAWFGLPESTQEYIEQSRDLPVWAALADKQVLGFVSMKATAKHTAEIHCMGVLPQFHRKGLGQKLLKALMDHARQAGFLLLQVKTVDEGHYPEYDRTIAFYESMGFVRLEVFPTLWDEWNPCLVLAKPI